MPETRKTYASGRKNLEIGSDGGSIRDLRRPRCARPRAAGRAGDPRPSRADLGEVEIEQDGRGARLRTASGPTIDPVGRAVGRTLPPVYQELPPRTQATAET